MTTGNTRPPRRKDGVDPVARSRARRRALQAIYAWQVSGGNAQQVIAQFAHEQAHEVADLEYFEDLVRGVLKHVAELDAKLAAFVDREVEQVDQIERAALRIAAWRPAAATRAAASGSSHAPGTRITSTDASATPLSTKPLRAPATSASVTRGFQRLARMAKRAPSVARRSPS